MEIFDKQIFGNDAQQWLKLCKDQKKEWILTHTSQTNESLIKDFIENPKISKECKCLDCGKNKKNESNGIPNEITTVTKSIDDRTISKRNSVKRPKDA